MSLDVIAVHIEDMAAWISWLESNHQECTGIWLRIGKKNSGFYSVSYDEALEAALCFGWIDALKKSYDSVSWVQRFTPRKAGSKWSKINREKAIQLMKAGLMRTSGLKAVEAAKQKGLWEIAYDSQRGITVPPDLQEALKNNPVAHQFFDSLNSVNRYAILHRIQTSVKPETRRKKIMKYITMLEAGLKLHGTPSG